jgi:hypothetical protein
MPLSAVFKISRIGRSGWLAGTKLSRLRVVNNVSCIESAPRIVGLTAMALTPRITYAIGVQLTRRAEFQQTARANSLNAMDAMERPWPQREAPAIYMIPLRPSIFDGGHCVDAFRC